MCVILSPSSNYRIHCSVQTMHHHLACWSLNSVNIKMSSTGKSNGVALFSCKHNILLSPSSSMLHYNQPRRKLQKHIVFTVLQEREYLTWDRAFKSSCIDAFRSSAGELLSRYAVDMELLNKTD